jgi:single-strand DNA-binding protein
MNKIILLGRLTRDPEVRYSQNDTSLAIAKYSLAVNRRFKRENEADVDFINCVAFSKFAEFAEKYFKKGMMVCISGRLQIRSYEDQYGQKRFSPEVIIEEQTFAESKSSFEARKASMPNDSNSDENNNNSNDDDMNSLLDELDSNDIPF